MVAKGMVIDYSRQAGNIDSSVSTQFAETISRQLTSETLRGASVVKREQMSDGTIWSLFSMPKSAAAQQSAPIIQQAAAQTAEFQAMNALNLMDSELQKVQTKPQVVTQ
jgi:hypothetical protein